MKKYLYYSILILINLMPFIPLSIKGILGLVFIIVSSLKFGFKETMQITFLLIFLEAISFITGLNVDYKYGFLTMVIGTAVYLIIAFFFGSYSDKMSKMLKELQSENDVIRNIEAELKQKVALQHSIMNTIPIPIYFKDLDFNYIGINPAFSELIGFSEKDVLGKNVLQLFDPSIAEAFDQMDYALLNEKRKQMKEITVKTEEGFTKTIIVSKALIVDDGGNASGIVGAMLDITEQKESEILKTNLAEDKVIIDELKRDDELKTVFFSNISHELRTPLNVIFSAVQLIDMYMNHCDFINHKSKIIRNVRSIKQNSLRLQRLVNNLIDITKIDSHAFELKLQNLDIIYVVEEISLSVVDFISSRGISLVFDTNIDEKIMAFDEEKIERIILNLLSNAIKYTPEGGFINVSVVDKGENVMIQIKDSGIGIPQEEFNLVFDRFYQISPINTRQQEGSGIGLNLVKSLVEMHQGDISVDSEVGKGTTFTIILPFKKLDNDMQLLPKAFDKQSRIEKIQLEFSDIYHGIME